MRRICDGPGCTGPRRVAGARLGRALEQLEVEHVLRALAVAGADAVRAGVAAAQHEHVPARRQDRARCPDTASPATRRFCCSRKGIAKWIAVELAPGNRQIARLLGAAREQHGVELAQELGPEMSLPTCTPVRHLHALGDHQLAARRSIVHFSSLKSGMP